MCHTMLLKISPQEDILESKEITPLQASTPPNVTSVEQLQGHFPEAGGVDNQMLNLLTFLHHIVGKYT